MKNTRRRLAEEKRIAAIDALIPYAVAEAESRVRADIAAGKKVVVRTPYKSEASSGKRTNDQEVYVWYAWTEYYHEAMNREATKHGLRGRI